jgi:hypothetical protein
MPPPSPCPECGSAGELDKLLPERCICTNPRCGLVYDPPPQVEQRTPYRDD